MDSYDSNENFEDDIAETILCRQQDEVEGEDSDGDEIAPEHSRVTSQDARRFVEGLRLFFMQEGNEGSPMSSLDVCADFVHTTRMQQST